MEYLMTAAGILVAVLAAAAIYYTARAAGYAEGYNAGHDSGMEDGFSDAWDMYEAFRLEGRSEVEKSHFRAAAEAAGKERDSSAECGCDHGAAGSRPADAADLNG